MDKPEVIEGGGSAEEPQAIPEVVEAPVEAAPSAPSASTALALRGKREVAAFDYGEDAGVGNTAATASLRIIKFLRLLQKNSAECEEGTDTFIEEAKPGQFFDPNSGVAYDQLAAVIIDVDWYYARFVEYAAGGGFKGRHEINDPFIARCIRASGKNVGKIPVLNTNPPEEIVETFGLLLVICDLETWEPLGVTCFPCQTAKIPALRKYVTERDKVYDPARVPLFAHRVLFESFIDTDKNTGKTFRNITVAPGVGGSFKQSLIGPDNVIYKTAKAALEEKRAGTIQVSEDLDQLQDLDPDKAVHAGSRPADDLPF